MENEGIKTLDIQDFKTNPNIIDYMDEDIVIINSLKDISHSNATVRLRCLLIAICIDGCIQLDINRKTYLLQTDDLLLGLPNSIISHTLLSPQHKIKLAVFSTRFLQRIFKVEKSTWNTVLHIHSHPIKSVNTQRDENIIDLYRFLINLNINKKPHLYHKEVIQHLFAALLCELIGVLNQEIATNSSYNGKESLTQSDQIFHNFIKLLSKDNGIHRSVSYYANELCYTPKYLSKVVKQVCGRTPLDLINEYTMEFIKDRLKRSDKSIKEIAEEFNFPNQSFFGKYVKTHLGMTPVSYRMETKEQLPIFQSSVLQTLKQQID